MKLVALTVLVYVYLVTRALSLDVPPNACARYFWYHREGGNYSGRVSLPPETSGFNIINVRFTLQGQVPLNFALNLTSDDDDDYDDEHGVAYTFQLPISDKLPKLTRIAVNEDDLCEANGCSCSAILLNHKPDLITKQISQFEPTVYPYHTDIFVETPIEPEAEKIQRPDALPNDPQLVCGNVNNVLSHDQFPWLAGIYEKLAEACELVCAGSLISSRMVIGSAHCFSMTKLEPHEIVVYLGRMSLTNYNDDHVVAHDVKNLLVHPKFESDPLANDVSLLHLVSTVEFNQYVKPICLWSEDDNPDRYRSQRSFIYGWGPDEKGNSVAPEAKTVDAFVVFDDKCLQLLEPYRWVKMKRVLCAGYRDTAGNCRNDFSGGLMVNINNRWILHGIISTNQSFVQQCDFRERVLYSDLRPHMSWLKENMVF